MIKFGNLGTRTDNELKFDEYISNVWKNNQRKLTK